MPEPSALLQAVRSSTADLLQGLAEQQWSDAELGAPSLCEGWTRAHVLTHLARNADGVAGTLAGALRGETVAQYPDGWESRGVAIEAGAGRPAAEILADLTAATERLDRVLGALADAGGWDLVADQDLSVAEWMSRRLREVEIHRVDLAGGYGPDRWPPLLIEELLPVAAATLADRAGQPVRVTVTEPGTVVTALVGREWRAGDGEPVDVRGPDWALLAWLVGRGQVLGDELGAQPGLGPWR